MTKQDILNAIKETTKENGGVPLGKERFRKRTGIKEYDIEKFWPRFSEAQREAGFKPNTLNKARNLPFLIERMVALTREIGRFPTRADLIGKRQRDSTFPSPGSLNRLGDKKERAEKMLE